MLKERGFMKIKEKILNENMETFWESFEEYKEESLNIRPDYKEVIDEIENVKNSNQKIKAFVESGIVTVFSIEEIKSVFNIIELNNIKMSYEIEEAFKLGVS